MTETPSLRATESIQSGQMKKRYYLSMLSLFPLVLAFDIVYFVLHQSLPIFLMSTLVRFFFLGPINIIGAWFLYRPIDHVFIRSEDTEQAKKRIGHLTWYSTGWIFILGVLSVTANFLLLFLFPMDTEVVSMEKMPAILFLTFVPSLLYVNAIFPSFIAYFLINDFNLDLKAKTFSLFTNRLSRWEKENRADFIVRVFNPGFSPTSSRYFGYRGHFVGR